VARQTDGLGFMVCEITGSPVLTLAGMGLPSKVVYLNLDEAEAGRLRDAHNRLLAPIGHAA